jgi:hypothetical protein
MNPEIASMLEKAKNLPKLQQIELALLSELIACHKLGERKCPQDRMADYVSQVSHTYVSLIAEQVLQMVMQCHVDTSVPCKEIVYQFEDTFHNRVQPGIPILNNIRQALFDDFK